MLLKVGMASQKGPRQKNDDYCAISYTYDFYAISDGIGGAPYGDIMSKVACEAAIRAFDGGSSIDSSFGFANDMTSVMSSYLDKRAGATLLLAEYGDASLEVVWAGDTMAYRLRNGELRPVTVPGRVAGGGNALSKAVGYGIINPDRTRVDVRAGDRFVLCTDGIWEYVDEGEFMRILVEGKNAPLIADALCNKAASVGMDNSTCICIVVEECIRGEDGGRAAQSASATLSVTPEVSGAIGTGEVGEQV